MPEIRCPNCGRNNPDLLDVCQFCQTPLRPKSILHSGEKPTKKDSGELESIDTAQTFARKDEPPDLLAGLASQAGSTEDDDIPDWLASINPTAKPIPSSPSVSESGSDFFARFNQKESKPETPSEDVPARTGETSEPSHVERDELSEWFTQASEQPEEIVETDDDQSDMGWGGAFVPSPSAETAPPKEVEDLSWLHNLEEAAKQTGELQKPKKEPDWMADFQTPPASSASQGDLSWLDRLGGIEEPSQPAPEQPAAQSDDLSWLNQFSEIPEPPQPSQPDSTKEDLSWLNNFGTAVEPEPLDAANQQAQSSPFDQKEDLDWLNTLGGASEPSQPSQPFSVPEEQPASAEDLSWLNNLGKPSEPSAPPEAAPQEDLSWLNELGGTPEPLSMPPFEAEGDVPETPPTPATPLGQKKEEEAEPDWLKSATEARSMPSLSDLSTDWFAGMRQHEQEKVPPSTSQTSPFDSDIFETPAEPAALSNQDVDSLFSVDMPDWLSRPEGETAAPAAEQTGVPPVEGDDSLAPVDLPSWVQAMRPMEAVITETTPSVSDQPAETEGPLAGLHGVIPIAPPGSSRRPKPVSLTLQASDEQQASAILLEEILGTETSPRALVSAPEVTSQQWLRWALTSVFLLVLSAVIFMRSQFISVSANLPENVSGLPNAVMSIPPNSNVLIVIDYEPSLAGEMEAVAGPLLDQVVLLSQPDLSFISTSPNGAGLVQRLMANTKVSPPGANYHNLGYLPGGSAGVLGFIEAPGQIIPSAGV